MSARFWVGGSGAWNSSTTTHWSNTSGGAGGFSVPTASDSVRFDGNSGGAINVSFSGNALACASFNATGYNGLFSAVPNSNLSVSGNINLSGQTMPANLTVVDIGSPSTVTSGGGSFGGTFECGTASVTLADAFTCGSLVIASGSLGNFNANNKDVTTSKVQSVFGPNVITMGSGTWTLTGPGTVWTAFSGDLISSGTSTIKITDVSSALKQFSGQSLSYHNIWLTGAGTGAYSIVGSNTFADFKVDTPPDTVTFDAGGTTTITTFTVNGAPGQLVTLQSATPGSPWNLSCPSGAVSCNYLSLKDSHASGGAKFRASNSVDAGGNTGWVFQPPNSGMMICF